MSETARTALRGIGQTLMTLGVVILLFCAYELWITGLVTAREQDRLRDDLTATWADPKPRPAPGEPELVSLDLGEGFAVLHVPSLEDYDPWVVVEGTSVADLKNGPGHIPGTALPGDLGNVVISGHRTTYGAPFARFGDLVAGHVVVLETEKGWFTYTVRKTSIVAPTAVEVTFAVPGDPTAKPDKRLLTLTTCHPKYSAKQRLIILAELTAASSREDGPPAVLTGEG